MKRQGYVAMTPPVRFELSVGFPGGVHFPPGVLGCLMVYETIEKALEFAPNSRVMEITWDDGE